MSKPQFQGLITALVTPFQNSKVDYTSFERLLEQQIPHVDGVVVLGTTGESPTVSASEGENLVKAAKGVIGKKIPILVGTGTNSTQTTIEKTQAAQSWGADGALVVTPYYNRPPQKGLYQHFSEVAKNSDLPILLYDVPGRTGVRLEIDTIVQLSGVKNIIGIKDATGDLDRASELSQKLPGFSLLCGEDDIYLDFMSRGGHGVISVLAHVIPKEMKELMQQLRQSPQLAQETFKEKFADLCQALFAESNPIPVKQALFEMGILNSKELRSPLCPCSEHLATRIEKILRKLNII